MALSPIEARFSRLDGPWRLTQRRNGDRHVYPVGDDIIHRLEADACPCGPAAELVMCPDCGDHTMYTHHALDGREMCERG